MTYANGEEGDRLVDAPEGGNIDGLATDSTLGANASRVFTGTGVDDGVDKYLECGQYERQFMRVIDKLGWGSGR